MRAGISRSVIGRIERGDVLRIAWADLVAVAEAVGARLDLEVRWQGERLDRLLDERHAATVEVVVDLLHRLEWIADVEVSFAIYGERGSIDIVGRHSATGLVATFEVKASIGDANQTIIGIDRKTRLARDIARERGWICRGVARFLVIADGTTSRSRIERHAGVFGTAFPLRGRDCVAWLRSPTSPPPSGLFFVKVPNDHSMGVTRQRVRQRTVRRVASSRSARAGMP